MKLNDLGFGALVMSVLLNLTELLARIDFNAWVLLITSTMGIAYLSMKIYHQYLLTKKFKSESEKKNNSLT